MNASSEVSSDDVSSPSSFPPPAPFSAETPPSLATIAAAAAASAAAKPRSSTMGAIEYVGASLTFGTEISTQCARSTNFAPVASAPTTSLMS